MASSSRAKTPVDPDLPEATPGTSHVEEYAAQLASEHDKINLGCGTDLRAGWLNVDILEVEGMDFAWNLEDTPWPWPGDSFEVALMDNVLEHIQVRERTAVLREVSRILEPGGILVLRLPVPEAGVGWDETHYAIPSWRVLEHPRWRETWDVQSYEGKRVGLGRLLPEQYARLASRQWIRCVDEVTVRARRR